MSIVFIIPYVPIPRMVKRIKTSSSIDNTSVIFWDRGTDEITNLDLPSNAEIHHIKEKANEGQPLKRLGATFRFSRKAFSILKTENPTCIHVTKTDMLLLVWLFCITRKKRPSVIYEVSDIHVMAFNNSKSLFKKVIKLCLYILERIGMSVVDRLIITSESFWNAYYKRLIPKRNVLFLPNTPRESIFKSYKPKEGGRFRIGFIGKVRYKEQLKLLIDASERADIDILIAGNGVDLSEITDYCRGKQNIIIYGPYKYEEEIATLYSEVDCIYSMYDTKIQNVRIALPNRLYEAAICGLPLIVSKETELSNIVEKEVLGVSVADGNINELTNALLKLKNDFFLRREIKENCRSFYLKWKYDVVNQKLIDTFKELTKKV
ncbi:glycosyltransferase [Psychrobacillus sp. FSL H8-0483]|uniref:glycosyltransferase n=1 Tax=Psychrobacillus sp. FSL H8-0483 TaxID=2921389 RepID=UPI00315AED0B